MTTRPLVGVIGLGPMGAALALRLDEVGFEVVGTSRSAGTRNSAAQRGIAVVEDVPALGERLRWEALAGRSPVVLLSLPSGPQVREALLGEGGLLRDGDEFVVIDTSTCDPGDARALAEEAVGQAVVDAPVSGGPRAARAGELSVMTGGSESDLAAADGVVRAIGDRVTPCGGAGAGQVAKACNQLVVTANIATVAEALVTASALGADPAAVREALLGGYAGSRVLEAHGERMLRRDFEPGGAARTHLKDIGIIRQLTDGVVDNAVFDAAARLFQELVDSGGAELDHSAAVKAVERRAGHSLGP